MSLDRSYPEVVDTILPETVSRRKLPVNFNENDAQIFQHELERTIAPSQLLKFHDIRVSAEGFLLQGLKLRPESFAFPSELQTWKLRSIAKLLATNYLFRQRRVIDEALWITDYWSTNYFHWLTDTLSRLFAVRDRVRNVPILLPASYEARDFVKASLEAFAIPTVDFIKPTEVLECRTLLLPTHTAPSGHYNDEVIRGVRSLLLKAYGYANNQETGDRIYLSRERAGRRRIVNEDEVTNILRRYDFRIIHAEELPFERQVQIFSQTRYLVSNHGAGLTNMLFMPEGGSVLELRHASDHTRNWFFILSAALNLNYFYQLCQPQDQQTDPHYADLLIDVKKLEENLNLMLS